MAEPVRAEAVLAARVVLFAYGWLPHPMAPDEVVVRQARQCLEEDDGAAIAHLDGAVMAAETVRAHA